MKNTLKKLLPCLLVVLCLALAGCKKTCEHKAGAWEANVEKHWHVCTECSQNFDEEEHKFGEWEVVTPASVGYAGLQKKSCSVCKYYVTEEIPAIVVETGVAEADFTVFAKAPADWSEVMCYYWGDGINSTNTTGWPGEAMTLVDEANNIWGFTVPAGTANVIFNNNAGVQTVDLVFATKLNQYTLTELNSEGKYIANYETFAGTAGEVNKYPTNAAETFRTVYVQLPEAWTGHNVHFWGSGSANSTWPGNPLTVVDEAKHIYSFEMSSNVTGFLFGEGDGLDQTVNIEPNADVNGYVVVSNDEGQDTVKPCKYENGVFTEVTLAPVDLVFYVKGSMNSWTDNDDYKLVANGENATITIALAEGDEFKVAVSSWNPEFGFGGLTDVNAECFADNGGNIKCIKAGTYVITITNYNADNRACTISPAA